MSKFQFEVGSRIILATLQNEIGVLFTPIVKFLDVIMEGDERLEFQILHWLLLLKEVNF